jgi:hypothetical protein
VTLVNTAQGPILGQKSGDRFVPLAQHRCLPGTAKPLVALSVFIRQGHIWTNSAPAWHLMEENLPKSEKNPAFL